MISVALCTYNGEKYIQQQIESILNQSIIPDEIIVCDDGSNDDTINILEHLKQSTSGLFKIFCNENNLGVTKNFEKAITLCSGDVIFLSDQDDIWVSDKIEKHILFYHQNPSFSACFSDGFLINKNNKLIDGTLWKSFGFKNNKEIIDGTSSLYEYQLVTNGLVTGATLSFKREVVQDIVPFRFMPDIHDYYIGLALSKINKLGLLKDQLIYYRLHEQQQIGSPDKSTWAFQEEYKTNIWNRCFSQQESGQMLSDFWKAEKLNQQFDNFFPGYGLSFRKEISELRNLYLSNLSFINKKRVLIGWWIRNLYFSKLTDLFKVKLFL